MKVATISAYANPADTSLKSWEWLWSLRFAFGKCFERVGCTPPVPWKMTFLRTTNPSEHGRIHTDSKSHDVFAIIAAITPRVVVMLPKGQKCYVPLYLNAGDILIFDSTVCHYGGITPNDSLVDGVSLGIHCYGGPVTEEILKHTFTC